MTKADVVIVGGGLAGAVASAILRRRGIDALVIDPSRDYPDEFRSEKLDNWQAETLIRNGIEKRALAAAAPMRDLWIARLGQLVQQRTNDQYGISYADLVTAVRTETPADRFVWGKVETVELSNDIQRLTLADGRVITARLVVLADGLNPSLRQQLGMKHEVLSACHSISLGFDLAPAEGGAFDFSALTYYSEKPSDRIAYVKLFPMLRGMRANVFTYRPMNDPWLRAFRDAPQTTLFDTLPRMERITGPFNVESALKVRPIDLYETHDTVRDGLVVIGDAFANSCPAAGTGAGKALIDADRLCNEYIPAWLASPGMAREKTAAFYTDAEKVKSDAESRDKAFDVRTLTLDTGLATEARRVARFAAHLAAGIMHKATGNGAKRAKKSDVA